MDMNGVLLFLSRAPSTRRPGPNSNGFAPTYNGRGRRRVFGARVHLPRIDRVASGCRPYICRVCDGVLVDRGRPEQVRE